MKKIEWDEKFSVNVKEIDAQHKKFIEIINKLIALQNKIADWETVSLVLDEMTQYLSYHFETEERYMRNYSYPEYEAHKKQHDFFKNETSVFISKVTEGQSILPNELLDFLSTWLIGHIVGSDSKYAPFLSGADSS